MNDIYTGLIPLKLN